MEIDGGDIGYMKKKSSLGSENYATASRCVLYLCGVV